MNSYNQRDMANSVSTPLMPCAQCSSIVNRDELIKYGTLCKHCFDSYCRQAPAYMPELDKYRGDSRAWAKRILDKHEAGIKVGAAALKFAQEVMA